MNGPPESPWQESLPPWSRPAQIMESVMSSCPYESRQCSSDTTGTSTFWRTRARLPPSVVVPHPETVQMVPSADSSNVGSHGDRALEREHADVVVDVPAVVVLVQAHVGHGERLLVRIVLIEVVASHLNSQLVCGHTIAAMSGSDDLV